jgi:hypothetical protein
MGDLLPVLLLSLVVCGGAKRQPNMILVMCDDLDKLLGGETAIPQVKRLLGEGGADAAHYFVSSPKCTPSRSAWLSGRHYHNLRPFGRTTGTGLNTSNFFDEDAVFPTLRKAGYKTALFGKIHNNQAEWLCNPRNHTEPFDHIETECSPCGGYYRTGKDEWVAKGTHDDVPVLQTLDPASPWSNYSEAQYGNRTIRWVHFFSSFVARQPSVQAQCRPTHCRSQIYDIVVLSVLQRWRPVAGKLRHCKPMTRFLLTFAQILGQIALSPPVEGVAATWRRVFDGRTCNKEQRLTTVRHV